jgi:hypothetical protein
LNWDPLPRDPKTGKVPVKIIQGGPLLDNDQLLEDIMKSNDKKE